MKKFFLCVLLVALLVSAAWGGPVEDFINETCGEALKAGSEQANSKFKALLTPERIRELINSGDDINAKGGQGVTLLMLASAFTDNPEIVRDLIGAGADVNAHDNDGYTALIVALADENANPEIIKLLLNAGADADYSDKNGMTARDYAKRSRNPEIQKIADALPVASDNPNK